MLSEFAGLEDGLPAPFGLAVRLVAAFFIAFVVVCAVMPWAITRLKHLQSGGQPIRADGPAHHKSAKAGTPTMGGLVLVFAALLATLVCGDVSGAHLPVIIALGLAFGVIGFFDDCLKIRRRTHRGLGVRARLAVEFALALGAALALAALVPLSSRTTIAIPFVDFLYPDTGYLAIYAVFASFVIVGSANAVNLTDGLDGLAIGTVVIALCCFLVLALVTGSSGLAAFFHLPHIAGAGELAILCAAICGGGLAFLWFNATPARIFMGDTGSLWLGATTGAMAIAVKQELLLALVGGVFVAEALSVIVQVASFRYRGGRRVFRMTPLHHHFELSGWSEPQIVVRFWVVAICLAIIGLSSVLVRAS